MDNKLVVKVYNVGCGDCIYVRVPDIDRAYHLLIDCGNYFNESPSRLAPAVEDVYKMVTEAPGVPTDRAGHLDLLVATHQHWDHIKGFESELDTFKQMKIDRIWLSAAMKPGDRGGLEAPGLGALQDYAASTVDSLADRGLELSPGLRALLMNSLSTPDATNVLRHTLPDAHGIEPLYAYRGVERELPAEQREVQLLHFKDPSISLRVLAPEKDVDKAYMGEARALLRRLNQHARHIPLKAARKVRDDRPLNVSTRDFRRLCTSMLYTSLLAARAENYVTNSTSVVLLLEWRGRRLLFTGDAEWTPSVRAKAREGSWEVMWDNESVRGDLSKPLDFLKVGHHGSRNATPWDLDNEEHPINCILDAILPRPEAGRPPLAKAVVSTHEGTIRATHNPVPHDRLMQELADRVANACEYPDEFGPQPQRTDKEDRPWIPVEFEPVQGYA